MTTVRSVIHSVLEEIDSLPTAARGGMAFVAGTGKVVPAARFNKLITDLEAARISNSRYALILFFLIAALLVITVIVVLMNLDNYTVLGSGLLGGNGGAMALLAGFRRFWREKAKFDLVCAVLPGSSPAEAVRLLIAIYAA